LRYQYLELKPNEFKLKTPSVTEGVFIGVNF